jgi:hypothetical protein
VCCVYKLVESEKVYALAVQNITFTRRAPENYTITQVVAKLKFNLISLINIISLFNFVGTETCKGKSECLYLHREH